MRRTKEQAAETKSQILKCAEDLIIEKGYEATTLEQVALAAGVTRGAVHWHFTNKEGLILAIRHASQLPFEELADCLGKNPDISPSEALLNAVDDLFQNLHRDLRRKALVRVSMLYELSRTSSGESLTASFRDVVERIFEVAAERGELRSNWTGRTASLAFSSILSGVIEDWALERSELDLIPLGMKIIRESMTIFVELSFDGSIRRGTAPTE